MFEMTEQASLEIEKSGDIDLTNFQLEYQQTIETLRSWDSLFFKSFSSIIISGGVGGGITLVTSDTFGVILFSLIILTAAYFMICLYAAYSTFFASKKVEVLQKLEERLGMFGVYSGNKESARILTHFLMPAISFLYFSTVIILLWRLQ